MNKFELGRVISKRPRQLFYLFNVAALSLTLNSTSLYASNYEASTVQITIVSGSTTVKDVFRQIEKNSEYVIFYNDKSINVNRKVNLTAKAESVDKVLDKLFQNTNNTYIINDKQIIIVRADKNKDKSDTSQKKQKIKGVLTDENGDPIIGATVIVKGTTNGAFSDMEGRYEIDAPIGAVLEYSYLGYNTEERKIKNGQSSINIRMLEASVGLDDVVVIGYGRQKKNSVVSSINSIKAKDIKLPTRNLTNNLAGQVAGLIAVQRSGEPGYDNSEFWIRGVSSFKGGTSPLVLVDGVPRNMNDIEPDEIESFSLLKDAAATAVYGAEGANGVILITSKRGTTSKPRISFRGEGSVMQPTRLPGFLGSADFLNLYNEALRNEGKPDAFSQDIIAKYASGEDPDLYPNTNWLDMMRDHTWSQRYTLNVTGGTEKARYFVSGAFFQESGIFESNSLAQYETNIGLKRYNLRSNVDLDITKTTLLSVDVSGQYLTTNFPGVGTSTIFQRMLTTPPFLMPMRYSDGTIAGHPRAGGNRVNPYNLLMESGYSKEWRTSVQSKVALEQKLDFITKGLFFRANISFDANMNYTSKRLKTPTQYQATGRDENGNLVFKEVVQGSDNLGGAEAGSNGNKKIYFETSLNYNKQFLEKHNVSAMLLYMQKEQQNHDNPLSFRKQGFVGRMTYNFDDRYFLEGNFGYTGSETFAKGHRYGFFPAGGVAWYVTNEHFFPQSIKNVMNKMKLRASVGKTGNDNTGGDRFMYRPTLNTGAGGFDIGYNDGGTLNGAGNGIVQGQFDAPFLSWEIEQKQNYGIDLGFFNNKIDIQLDYFHNVRSNILLQRNTVSAVTGFQQNVWQNFGKMRNQGLDASLVLNQDLGQVKLSARGNLTFARNKILEYDEIPQKYGWMEVTGTRANRWNIYVADGLYGYDDFVITGEGRDREYTLKEGVVTSSLGGDIKPGDIKYKDINGDGVINSFDQVQDVGNPSVPELVYGFGLNAEWKGFYAGIFFQGAGNTSTVLGASNSEGFFPFQWGFDETSIRKEALNRWSDDNPNPNAMFPRLRSTSHPHNSAPSTWWMRNASFLRLKNVEIGYNFNNLKNKLGVQSMRIYVMGYNLAVWDQIKMWDPEIGNANAGMNYPLPRTFTFGLDFTF